MSRVREKSVKSLGIWIWILSGNPVYVQASVGGIMFHKHQFYFFLFFFTFFFLFLFLNT